MPGERLVCVLQAAYVRDPETSGRPRKDIIQALSASFDKSEHINYKPAQFDAAFKEKTLDFNQYRAYVMDSLADRMAPANQIEEEIEKMCWAICKPFYRLEAIRCPEPRAFQLWQIFNRLVAVYEVPPRISVDDALWLTERLVSSLGRQVTSTGMQAQDDGVSFGSWLRYLDQNYLGDLPADRLAQCVEEVHSWLVREISLTGWLQKRTRKQSNWTNWLRRWFVLTPGKLTYYKEANMKEVKGEVAVTKHSKIESLADYKKSFRSLRSIFKITNAPYLEIELSAPTDQEKKSWMTAIRDIVEAARAGTTPVTALLQERAGASGAAGAKAKTGLKEVEEKFKSIRVTPKSVNPAATKAKAAAAKQAEKASLPPSLATIKDSPPESGDDEEEPPETFDNNFLAYQENKMKAVFSKLDQDGNGFISEPEFEKFIEGLGVKMGAEEIQLVFKTVDANSNGKISLTEFTDYFVDFLTDETGQNRPTNVETRLRSAFLAADRDGTGTVDFKEFVEFAWERKRSVRVSRLLKTFQRLDSQEEGEVSFPQFRKFIADQRSSILGSIIEESEEGEPKSPASKATLESKLKNMYETVDDEDLAQYLRGRWNAFVSFRREGASGDAVMTGGHGFVADYLPGEYNLVDLACFSDLPPLEPNYCVVKARWEKALPGQRSGSLIFPEDFDGVIPTDIATNEQLRYYGCSLADQNQVQVALLYRHAVQDFTYQNSYLTDYVTNPTQLGGAGIERHGFSHLDCPLDSDNGTFIMAKFVESDEEGEDMVMHITGFKVPTRHTLYIPPFTIHSNDYLRGTWRTMLSDEAEIDHVQLMQRKGGECTKFNFTFK